MPRKKKAKHKKTPVILIAAIQQDRGIGFQGNLLFHIKEDMQHFVETTTGHTVIMGRKTWESIPEKYRPFKNRVNIVVTRNQQYKAPGAIVVNKFYEALEKAPEDKKIYVIGGGEIYRQALSYAEELELTIIHSNKKADSFFPNFEPYFVREAESETYTTQDGISYQFVSYLKK